MLANDQLHARTVPDDMSLARDQAEAEVPFRALAHHAKELGLEEVASDLVIKANEASDKVLRTLGAEAAIKLVDGEERSPEAEYTKERILELLSRAEIMASTWIDVQEVEPEYRFNPHGRGGVQNFGTDIKTVEHQSLLKGANGSASDLSGSSLGYLKERGAAEVVVFSAEDDGSTMLVRYSTTIGAESGNGPAGGPNYQQNVPGVPGIQTRYSLLVPYDEGVRLKSAIREDPRFVHKFTDTLWIDYFGVRADLWKDYGPHYDEWRELNGGVSCIALYDKELPGESTEQVSFLRA